MLTPHTSGAYCCPGLQSKRNSTHGNHNITCAGFCNAKIVKHLIDNYKNLLETANTVKQASPSRTLYEKISGKATLFPQARPTGTITTPVSVK